MVGSVVARSIRILIQKDADERVTYLRFVHLMEDIPDLYIRNSALNQYPRCPAIWNNTFVIQGKSYN
jgi:hypothetical protein